MRNAFAKEWLKFALENPKMILITGDLGYGVLDEIASVVPDQYINAGIAEQSMMSMAAGLASEGYRPFVYSIANFPTIRCLEQIRNDVCYMKNSVTIVSVGAGLGYGNLGYSHHAIEDISIMRSLPNLDIYSPADSEEVNLAIAEIIVTDTPSYLRLGKGGEPKLHSISISSIAMPVEIESGIDGFVAFTGGVGARVLDAIEIIKANGLRPSVFSVPKLTNESIEYLVNKARGSFLVTVEEHSLQGGFGSWVLEANADSRANIVIKRMGLGQAGIEQLGTQSYLLDKKGLSAESIAQSFFEVQSSFQ